MLLITRMIQNCSFMICRVLRSSCRETKDRPRRTPSHCSRPFQFFKSVRVAAQAAGTTYLGVAPNWEDFIAAHTSDNTPSAMRGKLLKDYRVRKAKAKKPCISALTNKTVCTLHKPVAAPPKHSPMMRERHLVTPLKRNSCSASSSPFASSACPRTARGHNVAHVDVHQVTCTAVLRAQTQLETCPGREWLGPSHLMLVDQTTWC